MPALSSYSWYFVENQIILAAVDAVLIPALDIDQYG